MREVRAVARLVGTEVDVLDELVGAEVDVLGLLKPMLQRPRLRALVLENVDIAADSVKSLHRLLPTVKLELLRCRYS